ncbi:MAG TPA: outer membrane protein assembly factor BamE [Longimicrobium sp.]
MAEARMMVMLAAALVLGTPAAAQTISQGMTTAQVRSVLGDPVAVRTAGDWSYLYYLNGCAVRCGSDDVVFVQNDRVVAAVFRTARRRFSGPTAVAALDRADPSRESGLNRSASPSRGERPLQMRDIRNEPAEELVEGAREEPGRTIIGRPGAGPPARVGGVRVEGDEAPGGRTTIIRREDEAGDGRRGSTVRADTAQGAPATAVDDARRARENRMPENTIPRADTTQDRRRTRERNVAPRAVPRP